MPSSNILLFDANKANMMADEQYNTNTQRLNGVQSGIASSQLQNKTLYQVSLVAYAIAQIMNQNGLDANDTAAVSAFVANLSGTMLQKVADLATTQEAQAGVATGKWMSPALVRAAMDTYTSGKWLPLTGGTMSGNLILNTSSPTTDKQAASKGYVDSIFKKKLVIDFTTTSIPANGQVEIPYLQVVDMSVQYTGFCCECTGTNFGYGNFGGGANQDYLELIAGSKNYAHEILSFPSASNTKYNWKYQTVKFFRGYTTEAFRTNILEAIVPVEVSGRDTPYFLFSFRQPVSSFLFLNRIQDTAATGTGLNCKVWLF